MSSLPKNCACTWKGLVSWGGFKQELKGPGNLTQEAFGREPEAAGPHAGAERLCRTSSRSWR